jgi:integrase
MNSQPQDPFLMPADNPRSNYPLDSSLTLAAAAPKWLASHHQYIRPNTIRNYRNAIRLLTESLGDILVKDVQIGHIRAYQAERGRKAGCYLINGEMSVLQMIMKEAGEWSRVKEFYKPMRVPKRRGGHSISSDEECALREVAFSRPKWRLAAHCMMVMLSTTMGFGELRHVRRRDVDMKQKCVLVRDGAKNLYRDRTIPMNSAAYDSMGWIIDRWEKLGGARDDQFILPHRPRVPQGPWLFEEPMLAITTAFNQIRIASGLRHFRLYDCRVQAITKLLSNPMVSQQVCREIAGHVSQAMTDRYSIQRFDTKMTALQALESPKVPPLPEPGPPPVTTPPAPMDFTHAAMQAEITRQVALALHLGEAKIALQVSLVLQREREQHHIPVAPSQPPTGPRLLRFPGKGNKHA